MGVVVVVVVMRRRDAGQRGPVALSPAERASRESREAERRSDFLFFLLFFQPNSITTTQKKKRINNNKPLVVLSIPEFGFLASFLKDFSARIDGRLRPIGSRGMDAARDRPSLASGVARNAPPTSNQSTTFARSDPRRGPMRFCFLAALTKKSEENNQRETRRPPETGGRRFAGRRRRESAVLVVNKRQMTNASRSDHPHSSSRLAVFFSLNIPCWLDGRAMKAAAFRALIGCR